MAETKPTYDYVRALVESVGGSLTEFPYSEPAGAGSNISNDGVPSVFTSGTAPIRISKTNGRWGAFYWLVGEDMKYHLLQYDDDVLGSANFRALPDNWIVRLPSTAAAKAKEYLDQYFIGDPQYDVKFPTIQESEHRTEMEAAWTAYVMTEAQREEQVSAISPLQEMKICTSVYGLGSRYDVFEGFPQPPKRTRAASDETYQQQLDTYEYERRTRSVFTVRTIHPLNVAFDLRGKPAHWAMIREPLDVWEAAERYPHWRGAANGGLPRTDVKPVCKVEFWTAEWHACYLDGDPAYDSRDKADENGVVANIYGHVPVTFAGGAFGEPDVASRPHIMLQGLMRKIRAMLLAEALVFQLEQIYLRAASLGGKRTVKVDQAEPDGPTSRKDELGQALIGGPGETAFLPFGWTMEPTTAVAVPQFIETQRERIKADINAFIIPDQPGPVETATGRQIVQQVTQKRVGTDVLHMQQALEQQWKNRLRALKRLAKSGDRVYANLGTGKAPQWQDLDPSKLPDIIEVECKLSSDSETEKARKLQTYLALKEQGYDVDERILREILGDPDPAATMAGGYAKTLWETVGMPLLQQIAERGAVAVVQEYLDTEMATKVAADPAAAQQIANENAATQVAAQQQGGAVQGDGGGGGLGGQVRVGPQGAMLPGEQVPAGVARATGGPGPNPAPISAASLAQIANGR